MTVHAMRRPRIKPEHRVCRTADGWVWALVQAMDGTRSATDVVAEVYRRHPELRLPAPDIAQAMTDLTDAGHVEDAGAEPPAELSERERERHSRGMTLLRRMDLRPGAAPGSRNRCRAGRGSC
ncbi:hypothetical protein [Streptomyces salinarius]|uniref:hypothetical protein n=1 Tax=Streptomyces salinarius TaxID=2762598 RepID=UPI0028F73692|nr:hypothetical protein [Streptomyces salinarius]